MTNTKVYLEIVKQLREMITALGLESGDKLPSERELSERLSVGRSSVREALRALELLGLIETRRGEGTYIRDFRGHQLVQLLSTFILQDDKAKRDVLETKEMIEMDCIRLAILRSDQLSIEELKHVVQSEKLDDDEFFYRIIVMADNHLFLRMWLILKDYYYSLHLKEDTDYRKDYSALLDALSSKDEDLALTIYKKLRNLSFFNNKN